MNTNVKHWVRIIIHVKKFKVLLSLAVRFLYPKLIMTVNHKLFYFLLIIQKYSMKNFFWMANHFHYIEYFSKLLHIVYNKMQFSSKIVLLESWKRVKFMTWKKYYSIREKYDWTVGRKKKRQMEEWMKVCLNNEWM